MHTEKLRSDQSVETRDQVHGIGTRLVFYVLCLVIAFPPGALLPFAHAAFVDETAARLPTAEEDSYGFAVADVDGVNGLDIVVAVGGQSRLLINDGTGHFTDDTAARLPVLIQGTLAVAIGDVDGVNGPDILLAGRGQNRLLINDGSGNFADETAARMPINTALSTDAVLQDVDADSDLDIFTANRNSQNRLLINDGAGNFTDLSGSRLPSDVDASYAVILFDADANGTPDAFIANQEQQNRLLLNNGLGTFTDATAASLLVHTGQSHGAVALDVEGDGDQDIAVADGEDGVRLLINDGAGVFAVAGAGQLPAQTGYAVRIDAGDIDFDGSMDLVLGNAGQDQILLNDGAGAFSDATSAELPSDTRRSFGVELADGDADLDLDLLVATPQGQDRYYDNALPFPRILVTVSPDYIEVTDTANINVDVFDEDGIDALLVEVIQPDLSVATPVDAGGGLWTFVPAQVGTHTARVTATDNLANTGIKTASFEAQANDVTNPVVTVDVDPANITQGEFAEFSVAATDDRVVVSRTLAVDGVAVPLDASGNATYAPLATGILDVIGEATDAAGNVGAASTTISVAPDDSAPIVALSALPTPIDITNPITITASATDNIRVTSFGVTVSGPAGGPVDEPVALDGAGIGTYTPYIPGTYAFTATAADPAGNVTVEVAEVEATGIPDAEPPAVTLSVVPSTTIAGGTVAVTVNATDNIFVLSRSLEINGSPVPLVGNEALFTAPVIGDYTAVATATDPTGNVGSDTVVFSAVDPATDEEPPEVAITSPAQGSDITSETTFVGTATDLALTEYRLMYRRVGTADFTTFHVGTRAVEDDVLGTLDTSALENGLYDIRLEATDINGLQASVVQVFTVVGEFKPGIFTISYTDLEVPVSGIGITINRTYDSRRRSLIEDFGNGWNLEVFQDGTYTNNRALGDGWFVSSGGGFFNPPCSISNETKFHITEIRFSDTEFYKFAMDVEFLGWGSAISGGCDFGEVTFIQIGGVPGATLEIVGSNEVFWGGGDQLLHSLLSDRIGELFEGEDVRLTTLDGRVFDLNLTDGLQRIGDLNGNSVFINDNGVVHSDGTAVFFARDGAGRITRITDPSGEEIVYAYDGDGNLSTVDDRNGSRTAYFYVADNYLERIVNPEGNIPLRNEYDASGLLVAQVDGKGNRTEFDRDTDAGIEQVTGPDGTVTVLQYDELGNATSTETGGVENTYTYDDRGNRLTSTDPNGNTRTFTWNDNDHITSDTDALGNTTTYDYDVAGRLTGLTDTNGNGIAFTYDSNGNVTEQRDAGGGLVQGFVFDGSGNPTSVTVAAGTTTMGYDGEGNVTSMTATNGLERGFGYDASNRLTSSEVTRTVGGSPVVETTSYAYDANGNQTSVTDALGNTTAFAYDGNNRKVSETDALGRVTTFAYEERDLLERRTHPDGSFDFFGYDQNSRLSAHTDRAGQTTFFEYDSRGNRTRTTYPDGGQYTRTYDGANNLLSETDPAGNTTTYAYDAINRITTITDPLGNTTTRTYADDQLQPATLTDELGNTTTFSYDTSMYLLEQLTATTVPGGAITSQTWGDNSQVATVTDENGNTTAFTYDPVGNLTSVTDGLGNTTAYTYDEVGNRLSQTDANGNTTTFTYDAIGQMLTKSLPGGEIASWSYDAVGNVVEHTNFDGGVTQYQYDSLNRMTRRTFPSGANEVYTYTDGDQIDTVTNALGVTSFTYDERRRLLSAVAPGGDTITYTYDLVGNRTSITTPAGKTSYIYDALNRTTSVIEDPDGTPRITTYAYDAAGNLSAIGYPNGTEATMAYDTRDRVVRVTHRATPGGLVLLDYQYTLDDIGNRLQMLEDTGRQVDYAYDAVDRLVSVEEGGVTKTYDYDAAGNIVLMSDTDGLNLPITYNANDQVVNIGARSLAYDDNGNLLSITDGTDVTSFEYDSRNLLTKWTAPDGTMATFVYDHDGNRVSRTIDGVTTKYIVDTADPSGLSQVVAEQDGSGSVEAGYVYGHDLISQDRGGTRSYYHADALGSTRALTNDAGEVTDTYAYGAFGDESNSTGSTTNEIRFTGEREDPTSLYHLRARYYDPEIARFLTRDPVSGDLTRPLTLNPYIYATNNPALLVDPSGEFVSVSIAISISISIAVVYFRFYKPAKDIADKLEELAVTIPNMRLNNSVTREELGLQWPAGDDGGYDAGNWINVGDGSVSKAYGIVNDLVSDTGKYVSAIHMFNSANWLKSLPSVELMVGEGADATPKQIPGGYVSCSFNHYVQTDFVLAIPSASLPGNGAAIVGTYMAYFTFLALMGSTIHQWAGTMDATLQPIEGGVACPGIGVD